MSDTATVPEVTADSLREMLDRGEDVAVLDIRPDEDFEEWHIPGSRHVGGYEALKEGTSDPLADLSVPDDRPVVTVCGSGRTSRLAAERLRQRGVDARSLRGGMRAWTFAWNAARIALPDHVAKVIQLRRTGKGCLSYLIASEGEAVIVDPSLAPGIYIDEARRRGWRIVAVLDTHLHADHLSRARLLSRSTEAPAYLPRGTREAADAEVPSLGEGDSVEFGRAVLHALHTPGHTPESLTYGLGDAALFTGDTLFTDGVGRPDLEAAPDEARRKARQLHRSLHRLFDLPSDAVVLPGHTSRPVAFDGSPVAARLADVRSEVDATEKSEADFVRQVLARVPPAPPNHEEIVDRNRSGRWPEDEGAVVELEAGANRCAVG